MPYFISDATDCPAWAVVKADGEVIACHESKQGAVDQMVALSLAEDMEPGGELRAPAPPSDQITGSDMNDPGSASGAGGDIAISPATETALRNKVTEHNDAMKERDRPAWTRATYGQLGAVYRRGSGAYSTSHRPGIGRAQWSMARVNAYLFLLRTGAPENPNYVTDNDLLPEDHPRSTRGDRGKRITGEIPAYIRDAASRGVELFEAGEAGDGVTAGTVRDARLMADGQISDDKVLRSSAWAARHAVDLDAPQNNDAGDDDFPGPGAVAHYLWGIDPLDPAPARAWFDRQAELIREGEMSSRIIGGEPIIISDIDGTILNGDTPIAETVAFLQETEEDVYIVTGRNEDQRAATIRALAAAGVEYEELIMNPGPTSDTLNFKRETAQRLLEEHDVVLAIENNASMRRMYRALGITAVNVGELPPAMRKATTVMETRAHFVDDMEIRAVGDKMTFKGYAAVFDSDSEPLPFIERIQRGAFARTLKSRNNIRMYVNHNDSQLLASTRSGTLRLQEDSKGLLAEADLPMTTDGRNMSILLEQRIVDSMSFGFSVPRGGDTWSADGSRRTLTEVRLHEVSVVTGQPAYAATTASVRKLAARVAVDEVSLAAALVTLESGEELDAAQADLIRGVVDQLAPKDVKPDNSLIVAKQLLALMEMQA
jgi:HK97 family phage prohead protease